MLLEQFLLRELIPSWEHLNDKNSWCSEASRSQSPKWITCITACYPVSEALCFTSNPECRWAGRGSGKHCLNLTVKSSTKGVGEGRYVWQHTQGSLAVRASQEQTKKNSWSSGEQCYGCIYETCTRGGALTGKAISSAQLCKHHRCQCSTMQLGSCSSLCSLPTPPAFGCTYEIIHKLLQELRIPTHSAEF